jgi:GT2 family glycosyltransferase
LFLIVVDNGSTNDSVERIRTAYPEVVLLESKVNLGFAGGNNIGIRYAIARGTEYLWLLNNDTEPAPDALAALVCKALTNKRIGAVASICYYASSPLIVQAWAGTRVNLWVGYARNSTEPHSDDWFDSLYGASILIVRQAIEEVGMLDEFFFHYWEETEFCLRLRKGGWRLAAAPDSRILHKVAASTGKNNPILHRYFTASGLRILRLHSPAPRLAMFLFIVGRIFRRVIRLRLAQCVSVWEGLNDYRRTPRNPKIR